MPSVAFSIEKVEGWGRQGKGAWLEKDNYLILILRDKVIETLSTLCKNVAITTQLIPC